MDIERGRLIEIVVSVTAVGLFVLLLLAIGVQYNQEQMSPEGGLVLIGAIVAFIFVMGLIGIGLAYTLNSDDEEEETA